MNEKKYTQAMSRVSAPETAVEKAVAGMHDSNKSAFGKKQSRRKYWSIAATAAVLCLVLLAGFIFHPISKNGENFFVLSAGAAEINTFEPVRLGELKCEFESLCLSFNEKNELTEIEMCEFINFPISCTGENIESVTYTVKGNGFFVINEFMQGISDKQKYEETTVELSSDEESVSSFTTTYTDKAQTMKLCLYTSEQGGNYCTAYVTDKEVVEDGYAFGKNFDYRQMYYELFSMDDYSIDVKAVFSDGSTQTKTLDLIIEKDNEDNDADKETTLIVSTKLAK